MNRESIRQKITEDSQALSEFYSDYSSEIEDFCEQNISDYNLFKGFVHMSDNFIGIVYLNIENKYKVYIF